MEFDPRKANAYSFEELMDFLHRGEVEFTDFQMAGLNWQMQAKIKEALQEIESKKLKEENDWRCACNINTVSSFQFYLSTYGDDAPHAFEAKMRIQELGQMQQQLYEDLFADMRNDMLKYKANVMQILFGRLPATEEMKADNSPIGRFLKADMRLTFQDLYRSGILPEGNRALENAIFKDDFEVPQLQIEELGEIPTDRTDVYFLGCPASGKSCVLAGFLNYLHYAGEMRYIPQRNGKGIDGCRPYYNALIRGVSEYKAPRSTGYDTFSFMQLDLGNKRDREVTVMELSGEAFNALSDANTTGQEVWQKLGVGRCLKNNNPKTLFFLVDYSCVIGKNQRFSAAQQEEILDNALVVFSSDGTGGKYGEKNCTMSRVQNVAVIVTKSDLMDVELGRPLTSDERMEIAFHHLQDRFSNFMENLSDMCKKYGINANSKNAYKPYVITFSLGQFYLGNSVIFDNTDSKRLADFVVSATDRRRRGLLDFF